MKEIETIIDITEPEEQTKETLVEQSGIKIWLQPKNWREKIKENKKLSITIAATMLIFVLVLGFAVSSSLKVSEQKKTISALETDLADTEAQLSDAKAELVTAQDQVTECQEDLTIAWKAWGRRNKVIGDVLENLFTTDGTAIEDDNNTASLDFLLTKSCDPSLSDSIFDEYR